MATGLRVIRGPDWSAENKDGGDGHVGTVVSYGKDKTAEIIWDNGYQTISSIGKDNKFELRVLDNAPVGIQHKNIICNSCHEDGVFGMRWSCTICNDYNLCSLCYVTGKHDITHEFNRYDTPKSNAVKVSARNKSKKVNALGIFPESHVVRGTHWEQNDLDGGPGMTGVVESLITPDSKSPRSAVTVRWQTGTINVCRVGYQGKVDIQYTDEAPGVDYYPEHLPVLDTMGGMAPTDSKFSIGDKVVIHLDKLCLKKVMETRSEWSAGMAKCIGEIGVIKSFASNGDADVEFRQNKYRLPPKVLKQVIIPEPGSAVRIIDDINTVKMFQEHHGVWVDRMTKVLGKVCLVKKIDSDGDVVVSFGKERWEFSPACCMPASKSELFSDPDSKSEGDLFDQTEKIVKAIGRHLGNKVVTIGGDGFFSQVIKATVERDLAKVKTLVAKYPKVTTEKEQGTTCLHIAANERYLAIVKFLVENHADINATDIQGDTPLMVAVGKKNTKVAEYLLDVGAQADIMNDQRQTVMHNAALTGDATIIHRLILKECDVNRQEILGNTPLHVAILKDETEAAEMILTAKTLDLTIVNKKGFNPIQMTAFYGRAQIAQTILQRNKSIIDSKMNDEYTALHIAAVNNHVDVAKVLLSQGASVNSTSHTGTTPLHFACIHGYLEIIQVLGCHGADVDACDGDNNTPLHLVMMQDKADDQLKELMGNRERNDETKAQIVTYLLERGANTDAKNNKHKTPIDFCKSQTIKNAIENFRQSSAVSSSSVRAVLCSGCRIKIANSIFLPCTHKMCSDCCQNVKVCPRCNKDVNKIIEEDIPVEIDKLLDVVVGVFQQIAVATQDGDLAKVKKLVAKRPQVTKEKEQGVTCLHFAAYEGKLAIVKFLVETHADINATDKHGDTVLMVAVGQKETEIAEFLMGAGAQTDTINDKGQSALHKAAYTGQATLVQDLVLKACDVNLRDKDGNTPLHDAIFVDETEAAERILTAKTLDLTIVNKLGFNPIHWTASHGRAQIAQKILQRNKSIVDSKEKGGLTALHIAAVNHHADVAKVLLSQGASVNSTSDTGATPLHLVCFGYYLEVVQVLVSAGADVNARAYNNNTPLHMVMMQENADDLVKEQMEKQMKYDGTTVQLVTYLLEHGANTDAKNYQKKTPIDFCESQTIKDILENFRKSSAPIGATTSSVSSSPVGAVLCSECLNKMANSIFLPCAHKILCSDCCQNVKVCPLCNKDVNKIIEDTVSAKTPVDPTPADSEFNIGDMVVIDLDTLSLKKVMDGGSVWSPDIVKFTGQIGVIKSFASNGDAEVEFKNHKYGLPPKVLRKIINPEPGSVARIIDDISMAKMFQEHHGGWVDHMTMFLGKVGRVKEIDGDGNVIVLFGKRRSMFCAPCCIPASESDLPSDSDSEGGLESSGLPEEFSVLDTLLDSIVFPQVATATHEGDLAKVKKLVAKRPQVTKEKEQGLTLLHIAAHEGELAIVKFLVESHADINATDSDGDTPLMVAVGKKETEIAEFLVGAGAQTDTINDKGRSPLHNAACTGQATLVQALVLKACDVNLRDKDGNTPLHDAILVDETEAAERILTAKTLDLTIVNKLGFNPIHWAALHGRAQIAQKILQRNKSIVDSKEKGGLTALHIAAVHHHADVAKVLLSQGASVNSTILLNGATPLHLGCFLCSLELVQVLVSAGADVNACDCNNDTPLHLVMMQDNAGDLLKELMEKRKKNDGTSVQIVTYLLEHGANKDAKNYQKKTPIDNCESQTIKDAVENFRKSR